MKKSVVKIISVVFVCMIMIFNITVTSLAKTIILDDWLPFEIWTGEGTAKVTFGDNEMTADIGEYLKVDDFIELVPRQVDVTISADDFIVSEEAGVTVITMKEEYLKTIKNGPYYFFAEFKEAQIPVVLYVVTEKVTVSSVVKFRDWTWSDENSPRAYISSFDIGQFVSADLFKSISLDGKELDKSSYIVSDTGSGVIVTFTEEYLRTLATGVYYFDVSFLNVEGIRLEINIPSVYTAGDYNDDGKTDASDARGVLRVAAKIDNVDESRKVAVDMDADGRLTAADARRVLRIAAKIDNVRVITVELDKNEVFETPIMQNNVMYQWFCDMPADSSLICEKSDNIPETDPFLIGGSAQRFTFSSAESGVYNARFKYVVGWEPDSAPADEVYYIITVK